MNKMEIEIINENIFPPEMNMEKEYTGWRRIFLEIKYM
jgi:hypothetical protein